MKQQYKHFVQDVFLRWGWGSWTIFIGLGLLITFAAVQATSQEADPIRAAYKEHAVAIKQADAAMVSVDELTAVRDCTSECRLGDAEITLYQSRETESYGMVWTTPTALRRYLTANSAQLPEGEFILTAKWTLEELGMLEHHRPLGSVMRSAVWEILIEMGYEHPQEHLQRIPEWEIPAFLALEVMPRYRQDRDKPADQLIADAN